MKDGEGGETRLDTLLMQHKGSLSVQWRQQIPKTNLGFGDLIFIQFGEFSLRKNFKSFLCKVSKNA